MHTVKYLSTFLEKNAERFLLACYSIFLVGIALEHPINPARTLALIALINYLFFNRDILKKIFSSSTLRIFSLLIAISFASIVLSPYENHPLRVLDWLIYIVLGISSVLIWKRKAIMMLLIIPISCLCASIATYAWSWTTDLQMRSIFTKDNRLFLYVSIPNRMGLLFAAASAISIGAAFLRKRLAIPLLALATVLSALAWLSQSRSAVFALFGTIILTTGYAFSQNRKSPLGLALVVILGGLFAISSVFATNRILATLSSLDVSYLLNGRDDIWLASWEIFLKSPLIGFGINSYHDALGALLALPENAGRFPAIRSQYTFWNAHQMVLGILCETGLAGLAAFAALIVRGIRTGLARLPESLPLLLMLAAFMVHGIGAYGFHRSWNSAIFFLPLGILEGMRLLSDEEYRK